MQAAPHRHGYRVVSVRAALVDDIKNKIEVVAGGDPAKATATDLYQGTAHSVRETLFKSFNRTNRYFECVLPHAVAVLLCLCSPRRSPTCAHFSRSAESRAHACTSRTSCARSCRTLPVQVSRRRGCGLRRRRAGVGHPAVQRVVDCVDLPPRPRSRELVAYTRLCV